MDDLEIKQCRLCLKTCHFYESLFSNKGVELVELLTAIKISKNDNLPTVACTQCCDTIRQAFEFRTSILVADKKLRSNPLEMLTDQCEMKIKTEQVSSGDKNAFQERIFAEPIVNALNRNKKIRCKICEKQVDQMELYKHVKSHLFTSQKCECGHTFDNVNDYNAHFVSEHNDDLGIYTCRICTMTFKYKPIYKIHLEEAHKERPVPKRLVVEQECTESVDSPVQEAAKSNTEEFFCERCLLTFDSESKYFKHLSRHDKKPCKICNKLVSRDNYGHHVQSHTAGTELCHLCGVALKNKNSLRGHIYVVHSTRTYTCEQCGKSFKLRKDLTMHKKKYHSGEKSYTCEHCGKTFFTLYTLRKHIDVHHLKLLPLACEYCDKKFATKSNLVSHVRIHTNDMPFRCEVCGDSFRQKVSLRNHQKKKHNFVEEITCYCPICGKGFGSEAAIASHKYKHERV